MIPKKRELIITTSKRTSLTNLKIAVAEMELATLLINRIRCIRILIPSILVINVHSNYVMGLIGWASMIHTRSNYLILAPICPLELVVTKR